VAWEGIAALVACLGKAVAAAGIVGVHQRRLALVAEEEKQLVEEGLRDAPCLGAAGTVAAHPVHLQMGNMPIEEEDREQVKMKQRLFVSVQREDLALSSLVLTSPYRALDPHYSFHVVEVTVPSSGLHNDLATCDLARVHNILPPPSHGLFVHRTLHCHHRLPFPFRGHARVLFHLFPVGHVLA